jgi:hypothetical protein
MYVSGNLTERRGVYSAAMMPVNTSSASDAKHQGRVDVQHVCFFEAPKSSLPRVHQDVVVPINQVLS